MTRNALHVSELPEDTLREVHDHLASTYELARVKAHLIKWPCSPVCIIWGPVDVASQQAIQRHSSCMNRLVPQNLILIPLHLVSINMGPKGLEICLQVRVPDMRPFGLNHLILNIRWVNQSLVGSVVIGAELGREDHSSIPRNCDREGAGTI
ncbi:hypothetical protein P8452_47042 [Trifolium repens]|nr:hypothetical protein P8452_47042 [Trifolium repens]